MTHGAKDTVLSKPAKPDCELAFIRVLLSCAGIYHVV
jgi:hypothetical protein